jgi:hypothetical protein
MRTLPVPAVRASRWSESATQIRALVVCLGLSSAACSPESDEVPGTTDAPTTEAPADTLPPRDPDSLSFCMHLADAFVECSNPSTAPTTTSIGDQPCPEVFAACSEADFDVLYGMVDCILADCADDSCYDAFSDLSYECLVGSGSQT